jgi:hypothetical protein
MGATSRGTISIRITIPPHVMVEPAHGEGASDEAVSARGLCVRSNGFTPYHLAILSPSGTLESIPTHQAASEPNPGSFCASANGDRPTGQLPDTFVRAAGSQGQGGTLLIVAD